jgi:hypothetical protein
MLYMFCHRIAKECVKVYLEELMKVLIFSTVGTDYLSCKMLSPGSHSTFTALSLVQAELCFKYICTYRHTKWNTKHKHF